MAPRKLFTSARSSPILGSNNDRDELVRLAKQNGVFSWSNFTRSFSCDFTGKLSIIFVYDTFTCLNFCFLLKATSSQCGRIASQGMTFQNKILTQAYFEHVHRNNHIQFENHRFRFSWRSQTANYSSSSSSCWNEFVSVVLFQLFA